MKPISSNPKTQIVLTGSVGMDQIMSFDGRFEDQIQADKLHVLSISVLLKTLRQTHGGVAGNIAYCLALLKEKPTLFASLGSDGKKYLKKLTRMGVVTDKAHISSKPMGLFSVITDQNNCQVGGFYPGAMDDADSLSLKIFQGQNVLIVLSPNSPKYMMRFIHECQKYKLRCFYDVGQQILALSADDLKQSLDVCEALIVNDYELGMLMKKTPLTKKQITQKLKLLVVTYGEQGVDVYDQKNKYISQKIPAVKLEKVIDPTGAGDAFRAGFLYGYVRNWPHVKSAQLGCVSAAYAVEKLGTQEHKFTLSQFKKRYLKTYTKVIEL